MIREEEGHIHILEVDHHEKLQEAARRIRAKIDEDPNAKLGRMSYEEFLNWMENHGKKKKDGMTMIEADESSPRDPDV